MSFIYINAVFASSKSKGNARLVLLALADRADNAGVCFCGAKDITTRSNISRASMWKSVKVLLEGGELEMLPKKGPRKCNYYKITLNPSRIETSPELRLVQKRDSSSPELRPKPLEPKKSFSKKKNGGVRSCL